MRHPCEGGDPETLSFFVNIRLAIDREKQLKKWKRQWKLNLIEKLNPQWRDLYEDIV